MSAVTQDNIAIALPTDIAERVGAISWKQVSRDLDAQSSAMVERLPSPDECRAVAGLYPKDDDRGRMLFVSSESALNIPAEESTSDMLTE